MKLAAPLEVGICVEDLTVMREFYEEALGFVYVSTFDVAPALARDAGMSADGYRIVRLQTSTGERIKLAQPATGPRRLTAAQPVLERRSIAFLTFIVDDLLATMTRLQARGLELRAGPKLEIRDGVYLAFAEDPEGNLLEFVEYDDVAAYRPDAASISDGRGDSE